MTDNPKVLHLGHTSAAGGAEFALVRMLNAGVAWRAALLLPPTDWPGVFANLLADVPVRIRGVRQPAGVSRGSAILVAGATARLVAQTIVTRLHPAFRAGGHRRREHDAGGRVRSLAARASR